MSQRPAGPGNHVRRFVVYNRVSSLISCVSKEILMIRRFAPLSLALAFAVASAPMVSAQAPSKAAPPAQTKMSALVTSLQGAWQMVTANGQDTAGSGQEMLITITDNKYAQSLNGQVVERGTFKIDETKKPMTIDLAITEGDSAGQTQLGVVEITGKTLTGKLADAGVTTRPTDFAIAEGFFVFKMAKK